MAGEISIEDFMKVDLRVALVKEAEKIPGTKLLRLKVDLGELGERQVIAGIGEHYSPEDVVGKKIIVVANIKPRRIRGYMSEAMLLAADTKDGRPVLLTVMGDAEPGARVR